MKLHRDLKVTQKTTWFTLHRIRKAQSQKRTDSLVIRVEWTQPTSVEVTATGRGTANLSGVDWCGVNVE